MPTYEYACTSCGEQIEVVQKFTDDPLTVCPSCGNGLRKVFSPVGIVFKGSGFYRTDSRKSKVAAESASTGDKSKSNGSGGSNGSGDSPAKKESASGDSPSSKKSSDGKKSSDSKVSQPAGA